MALVNKSNKKNLVGFSCCFVAGSYYVNLDGDNQELAVWTRVAHTSEGFAILCLPSAWIRGVCYHASLTVLFSGSCSVMKVSESYPINKFLPECLSRNCLTRDFTR